MEIRWDEDQPVVRDARKRLESGLIPELYSLAKKYNLLEIEAKLIMKDIIVEHCYVCCVYTVPREGNDYYVSIKRNDLGTVDAWGKIVD